MRYSHHQGGKSSIREVKKLAKKFDIETVVLDPGNESPLSDYNSQAFKKIEGAVKEVLPAVMTTPYIMVAASDCRYMHTLSKNCLRFTPLVINNEQLDSIHGIDENVDLETLTPAVNFYRRIIEGV
jgi:carboxypeptidase PM20D1